MKIPLKREFSFTVLGRGQQRGSKIPVGKKGGGVLLKNGRPVLKDSNKKSAGWMQEVKRAAIDAIGQVPLMTGPIELTAKFYFARPASHFGTGRNSGTLKPTAPKVHAQSPDLAKLLRSLEDALTKIAWTDDKLVFRYGEGTERLWTDSHERTEVTIREFSEF